MQAVAQNQSNSIPVPVLNFTSLSFTDRFVSSGQGNSFDYNGPSQIVESIAAAVGAQGAILPITPPSPNSSWHLEFYGPSLKCRNMSDVRRGQVAHNVANYFAQIGPQDYASPVCTEGRYIYLSWFQGLPFANRTSNFSISTGSLASDFQANATINIAALPGMLTVDNPCADFPSSQTPWEGTNQNASFVDHNISIAHQNPLGTVGEGAAMVECQFFNSTYNVHFEYVNGEQTVTIDAPVKSADPALTTFNVVGQEMGNITKWQNGQPTEWTATGIKCFAFQNSTWSTSFPDPCPFDPVLLRVIAYQGVIEAFANLLAGTVSVPYNGALPKNTSLLKTTLVDTNELDFLNDQSSSYLDGFGNGQDLQGALADMNITVNGIAQARQFIRKQPLTSALEEMFQNYTISLMSSDLLQ